MVLSREYSFEEKKDEDELSDDDAMSDEEDDHDGAFRGNVFEHNLIDRGIVMEEFEREQK